MIRFGEDISSLNELESLLPKLIAEAGLNNFSAESSPHVSILQKLEKRGNEYYMSPTDVAECILNFLNFIETKFPVECPTVLFYLPVMNQSVIDRLSTDQQFYITRWISGFLTNFYEVKHNMLELFSRFEKLKNEHNRSVSEDMRIRSLRTIERKLRKYNGLYYTGDEHSKKYINRYPDIIVFETTDPHFIRKNVVDESLNSSTVLCAITGLHNNIDNIHFPIICNTNLLNSNLFILDIISSYLVNRQKMKKMQNTISNEAGSEE